MKLFRIAASVFIPIITLSLGFHLGTRYYDTQILRERGALEKSLEKSGSGKLVVGNPETEVNMTLFWDVWKLLQKRYVHPEVMTVQKMIYGAITGLVASIGDPYTLFMTPVDSKMFQDSLSGTLEGIGAQLDFKDGKVIVIAPLKGSPAEKAGLVPKDVIIEVNGTSIAGFSLEEVVSRIRGPKDTSVMLGILPLGKSPMITKTLTRQSIHIPSVETKNVTGKTGDIALITLNQFGDDTVESVTKALENISPKTKGIILDLRFNGGGYLEGAVDIVSMFVDKGMVVTVERRDAPPEVHLVSGHPLEPSRPLVVLVNGGSASASEITAGALQDLKRATIVGTQTFGKGTVQEVLELAGGSSLRVTVARWLTPSGHDLGKKGITPDVIIDRTLEHMKDGKDPQLDKAMEILEKR
jgi:carboxyl-terminal processing protease